MIDEMVSIAMATYNSEKYLHEQLDSIDVLDIGNLPKNQDLSNGKLNYVIYSCRYTI